MEFAEDIYDFGSIKHIGYKEEDSSIKNYFSYKTIKLISYKVTELLQGVDHKGRSIIVPDKTIISVMNEIYSSYRPPTGDIFSRHTIPSETTAESYVQNMIDQVIEVITSDVRNNLEMEENNRKLSVWTTVYGDFNQAGLRQHETIKIREKRPSSKEFFMNY